MTVILWIVKILLALVLLLLVLMLALLCVRTGVDAVGLDGEISVEARYGPVRIPLYPLPKHVKKKKKPKEKPKPEKKDQTEGEYRVRSAINWRALDIGDTLDLLLTILSELSGALRLSRLRVRVRIGTDDAAKSGLLLGQSAALTGIILPFLENTFEMQDYHVDVDADFDADHTKWAFTVFCSLRPLRLIVISLRHSRELYRIYKRLTKKEEAIANE